jgi:hypothetical protein
MSTSSPDLNQKSSSEEVVMVESKSEAATCTSGTSEPLKSSEIDFSNILVFPKPKETSKWKRKPALHQMTVCLTDNDVFNKIRAKDEEKKKKGIEKVERKKALELNKEKGKKKKKQKDKVQQPDLDVVLEELIIADDEEDAICPNCGKVFSSDTDKEIWICCDKCSQWYDFKCTHLRSKRRLPDSYICHSCK